MSRLDLDVPDLFPLRYIGILQQLCFRVQMHGGKRSVVSWVDLLLNSTEMLMSELWPLTLLESHTHQPISEAMAWTYTFWALTYANLCATVYIDFNDA